MLEEVCIYLEGRMASGCSSYTSLLTMPENERGQYLGLAIGFEVRRDMATGSDGGRQHWYLRMAEAKRTDDRDDFLSAMLMNDCWKKRFLHGIQGMVVGRSLCLQAVALRKVGKIYMG